VNEAFFSLVTNRPDPTLNHETCPCRHCGHQGPLEVVGHCQTLVGNVRGADSNHHWRTLKCPACSGIMEIETKEGNSWEVSATEKGKLLRGVPGCFENYIYTCARCSGNVTREYRNKVSGKVTSCTSVGPEGRGHTIWICCDQCKASVESRHEYYGGWDGKPLPCLPGMATINFKAHESPGQTLGNVTALKRVDFV
jgi:hypothetical protein